MFTTQIREQQIHIFLFSLIASSYLYPVEHTGRLWETRSMFARVGGARGVCDTGRKC